MISVDVVEAERENDALPVPLVKISGTLDALTISVVVFVMTSSYENTHQIQRRMSKYPPGQRQCSRFRSIMLRESPGSLRPGWKCHFTIRLNDSPMTLFFPVDA